MIGWQTWKRRPAASLLLSLLASCLLPSCRHQTRVEQGDQTQTLHEGVGYELVTLDPQVTTGTAAQSIATALFEGLTREDGRDLHPVPGVADTWTVASDQLHYSFHLRPDARWSDGTPVTADDFVASWRRVLTPSFAAENANLLFVLRGAEAFYRGETTNFATVGVHAADARTLDVELAHPAPYFLALLSNMAWLPVPTKVIAAHGALYTPGNDWAKPGSLVGNGPFVLTSWQTDQDVVVTRSDTYWDHSHVRLNSIHFYPIDSVDTEERSFRAGQLHLTDALTAGHLDLYRNAKPPVLRIDPYLATYFYRINVRRPFLNDPRIRRALALAVDRTGIVKRVLRGGQQPAPAFTPPGIGGYNPEPVLATNYAEARALLAAAGHPHGVGLPVFELSLNTSENHQAIAEAVQEVWRRELGVEIRIEAQENKTLLAARSTGDYDILRSDWVADYADPTSFLNVFRGDSGNNLTGWSDAKYDALLKAAEKATTPEDRHSLWRHAEHELLTEAPIIPIYYYTHVFLIRPSVQGWYPTLLDHHPYQEVWLK
ncbi:MAG TPA: peptide ABC transporter substrate-binding protein [Opitutaceae bacterium]|jgi:oligopeptide transport system substrate-binding protein